PDAAGAGVGHDLAVDLGGGGGHGQADAVEVGRAVGLGEPVHVGGSVGRGRFEADQANAGAGLAQGGGLAPADGAAADHQAETVVQIDEHGEHRHDSEREQGGGGRETTSGT